MLARIYWHTTMMLVRILGGAGGIRLELLPLQGHVLTHAKTPLEVGAEELWTGYLSYQCEC